MATGVLQKGTTFADGMVVNAASLNNLVDLGDVLAGLISTKADVPPPSSSDLLLYLHGTSLFSAKFSELPTGVSSVGLTLPATEFTVTGSPVTTSGTLAGAWKPVAAGLVLAGPLTGSPAAPTFRALTPADSVQTTVNIAAFAIDWSLGNTFWKVLPSTGPVTFTFSNMPTGTTHAQDIKVLLSQGTAPGNCTVAWPTAYWPNHVHPVMTTGGGATDLYIFRHINGLVFGEALQNVG